MATPSSESALLVAAAGGDEGAFARLTRPYRRELHVHCYRMLGSPHDADDAVQETMLRAWRRLDRFEGRASLRTWLYRIATNVCLNMLERSPGDLAPYPDRLLDGALDGSDPHDEIELRETVELAFIAVSRRLPARQRAAFVLREALDWPAADIADLLGTSEAAVNSALQRARATIDAESPPRHRPAGDDERRLVGAFMRAWVDVDLDALAALLADDAILTMPPEDVRIEGAPAIREFFATAPADGELERIRLVETRANGQPGFACYIRDGDGDHEAYGIMLLTIAYGRIVAITGFPGADAFTPFELPTRLVMD